MSTKHSFSGLVVGFELEFISSELDRVHGSSDLLRGRDVDLGFGFLGEDGGCYELRTKPVDGRAANGVLIDSLHFLKRHKARTRHNDGLHINISCSDKKKARSVNPIIVWDRCRVHFWVRFFGRRRSIYCKFPSRMEAWSIFDFLTRVPSGSKDVAVNFSNFDPYGQTKGSRIEFRYPGGKDYHRKPKMVSRCLRDAMQAVVDSF